MTSHADLEDRLALVTGASRGIGAAISHRLLAAGAQVIRVARSALERAERAEDYRVDLADGRARHAFLREVE